jgi:hypothetical protein
MIAQTPGDGAGGPDCARAAIESTSENIVIKNNAKILICFITFFGIYLQMNRKKL